MNQAKQAEDSIGKAVESKWHPSWIKAAMEEEEREAAQAQMR
jgi:hypothetical protein